MYKHSIKRKVKKEMEIKSKKIRFNAVFLRIDILKKI